MFNSQPDHTLGLDLGLKTDRSALISIERVEPRRFANEDMSPTAVQYHLRHLERFDLGTPYTVVARQVAELCRKPVLSRNLKLIVDATGVGLPVLELLEDEGLVFTAVTITASGVPTSEGGHQEISKKDLISNLEILLETEQLKFAKDLPGIDLLVKELLAFRVKRNLDSGFETFGAWRTGENDDLVLALALSLWFASHRPKPGRAWIL